MGAQCLRYRDVNQEHFRRIWPPAGKFSQARSFDGKIPLDDSLIQQVWFAL